MPRHRHEIENQYNISSEVLKRQLEFAGAKVEPLRLVLAHPQSYMAPFQTQYKLQFVPLQGDDTDKNRAVKMSGEHLHQMLFNMEYLRKKEEAERSARQTELAWRSRRYNR